MTYQPELGQALFGQPYKEFEVPEIMEAALVFIARRLDTVMWNINQKTYDSPFSNSGNDYKNETFEAYAYDWGDEEQPYNFKWKDIEVSWYKYLGRGMSANMDITAQMASDCLVDCIRSIEELEKSKLGW